MTTVAVVSPGSMGAAVGACLVAGGTEVVWASEGRSDATARRANRAGMRDVGGFEAIAATADVVLSICPPHDAEATAAAIVGAGFAGTYVDANAIAPSTAKSIAASIGPATYVDGGIIGGLPLRSGGTRLYLTEEGARIAALFPADDLDVVVLDRAAPAASALKVAFAAWTKGSSALLLAVRAYAAAADVEGDLLREWSWSAPQLLERTSTMAPRVGAKAWRWVGEMEQIAQAFADVGLPGGIHDAAAELYGRLAGRRDRDDTTIDDAVADLLRATAPRKPGDRQGPRPSPPPR